MPETRVLLIESDSAAAMHIGARLTGAGYVVTAAETPLAAKRRLVHCPPDAVVLGVSLSDARELRLCHQARLLFPALPLIVVATRPDGAIREACLRRGVADQVVGPADVTGLCAAIASRIRPARRSFGVPRDDLARAAEEVLSEARQEVATLTDSVRRLVRMRDELHLRTAARETAETAPPPT